MRLQTAIAVEGYSSRLEDRAEVLPVPGAVVIVVADGAGGRAGGAEAADAVIRAVREAVAEGCRRPWHLVLRDADTVVLKDPKAGETTAVVLTADQEGVLGASVGDSGAWLITPTGYADLTSNQVRKPVIGSGGTPMPFWAKWPGGSPATLLVATDGLLKYASPHQICQTALTPNVEDAARALVDLVRLRSGALQDDVALVLCRLTDPPRAG